MTRRMPLMCFLAFAAVLTACVPQPDQTEGEAGNGTTAASSKPASSEPAAPASATPEAVVPSEDPAGPGESGPTEPGPEAGSPTSTSTEPPSVDPTSQATADPLESLTLNDRGNIPAVVGETSVFAADDGGEFAGFEAEQIQTAFECDVPRTSVNGQFVAIRFSVSATSELTESGQPYFAMTARDFKAWDSSGTPVEDPVGNSAGCVAATELLPSPIEPGDSVDGLVILDVPQGSGEASFAVGGAEGSYGWEWKW